MSASNLPQPVPLVQYGQYSSDLPEPKWKVKTAQRKQEAVAQPGRILYAANIPYPTDSRRVYSAYECKDAEELRVYTEFIMTNERCPPPFLEHFSPYPKSQHLACNLSPGLLLQFNSHFEGGNLSRAYALSNSEYDLYMTVDTNTKGHTQWFSFSVENTTADFKVKFNIVNFTKASCLLRSGLRPYFLSEIEKKRNGSAWTRVRPPVLYQRNRYERAGWRRSAPTNLDTEEDDDEVYPRFQKGLSRKHYYYTLSFEHTFQDAKDTVFFAFAVPYSFTRVNKFLESQEKRIMEMEDGKEMLIYRKEELCRTVLNLPVYVITITAPKHVGLPLQKRKGAVLTARVHPGETVGSYVMERVIDFLMSDAKEAEALRSMYVFKLIPMLNPDGVVCGNYRSAVSGEDLNRRWDKPSAPEHNPILHAKNMVSKFKKERDILIFCDLHGHSKKYNSFIYGCNTAANEGFASWTKVRLFPRVFARRSPIFSYKDCRFKVEHDKVGTGRVVLWKEFGITNSFTLETSFFGAAWGRDIREFELPELAEVGTQMLLTLLEYTSLLRQIEKEMFLNHGWLKPNRLKELTGTPAQEVLEKELERHKRDAKSKETRKTTISAAKRSTPTPQKEGKPALDTGIRGKEWAHILSQVVEKRRWRDYFSSEEIQDAFNKLNSGADLGDPDTSGSDSCPSDDNLESREMEKNGFQTDYPADSVSPIEIVFRDPPICNFSQDFDISEPFPPMSKPHIRTVSQPVIPPVEQIRPVRRRPQASSLNSRGNIHEFSSTNITSRVDSDLSDLDNAGSLSPSKPSFQTYQYDDAYGKADYNKAGKAKVLNATRNSQERTGLYYVESRSRGRPENAYATMESAQRRVSMMDERVRSRTSQRIDMDPHSIYNNKFVLKAISKHGNGKMYYLRRPANILLPDVRKVFVPSYQSLEIRSAKYELRHSSQGRRSTPPTNKQ